MTVNPEIFCPECEYRPKAEDRWDCVPSCGTRWHTFWTGAVCPGCSFKWPTTQCPSCQQVSPHADWYHYPPPIEESRATAEPEAAVAMAAGLHAEHQVSRSQISSTSAVASSMPPSA